VHDYYSGEEEISVEELIEAQRRLSGSTNPFERVVGTLCLSALLKEKLVALANATVGQLMSRYVLDDLNLLAPATTICQVATERLIGRPVHDGEDEELGGQMMTRVWRRALYVGSLKDAEHLASANPLKIAAVLSLCPEEIERRIKTIHYMRVPIADSQPISMRQFDEIMAAIEQGLGQGNLLIHCVAGFSRSPIMAAAWMNRHGYASIDKSLAEIAELRDIDPSPVLLRSVKENLTR
jgi:atypical dual specificity phosphatase